jgi:hypothetical protein
MPRLACLDGHVLQIRVGKPTPRDRKICRGSIISEATLDGIKNSQSIRVLVGSLRTLKADPDHDHDHDVRESSCFQNNAQD